MSREREIREQEIRMAEWCPVGDMAFLLSIIDEQRAEIKRLKSYERYWVADTYGEDSRQYRMLEDSIRSD